MTNTGIDYGLGATNIDLTTGIRYGVISQLSVGERWYDAAEPVYGDPTCPECGNPVVDSNDVSNVDWSATKDYACAECRESYNSDEVFSDEPHGWSYKDADEYALTDCLDSDIMVLKSPYYTFAQFCSPCVPGAGNLDTPVPDGAKTYCLGSDWFEDDVAPYPVYSVETGELV